MEFLVKVLGPSFWKKITLPPEGSELPPGGSAGDVLEKLSGADYDVQWAAPAGSFTFPVGYIYISVDPTNPATVLGYGTWTAFAAGRVLVGIDAGQTEFDTVEETGGAKTHTLITAEMPAHTHTQDAHNHTQDAHNHTQDSHNHTQNSHNHTQDAHTHGLTDPGHTHIQNARLAVGGSTATQAAVSNSSGSQLTINSTESSTTGATVNNATATNQAATATNQATTATNQATTATNQAATATNQNTGGGGAHNNLQPYIVVHMFKRTS